MRERCPHIPCMVIANKIDIDEKATARRYKFIEEIGCPFNFVSAANGTNVVAVFQQALEMGLHYKQNPHQDDFMNEVLDLLKDSPMGNKDDDEFWEQLIQRLNFKFKSIMQFYNTKDARSTGHFKNATTRSG